VTASEGNAPSAPWRRRFHARPPTRHAGYFAALVLMVASYLCLVEVGKHLFYRVTGPAAVPRPPTAQRHQTRRATRFSTRTPAAAHPARGSVACAAPELASYTQVQVYR